MTYRKPEIGVLGKAVRVMEFLDESPQSVFDGFAAIGSIPRMNLTSELKSARKTHQIGQTHW